MTTTNTDVADRTAAIVKRIEDAGAQAKPWKDRRVYVRLASYLESFRGCRTHQLYVDVATGRLVDQMGKGVTPRSYDDDLARFMSAYNA